MKDAGQSLFHNFVLVLFLAKLYEVKLFIIFLLFLHIFPHDNLCILLMTLLVCFLNLLRLLLTQKAL